MKHGNIVKYAGFLGFTALILIFSGCFLSAPTGELVSPTIRAIGLPDASIVGSVTLKVTGPDMAPVEVSYTQLPSVINIAVPEGNDRKFELTVTTGSSYKGAIASYKGTAAADITSDSAVVTLNMGIGSTKIIVPDYSNNRVLQFDDINSINETKLSSTDNPVFGAWLGISSIIFLPYEIDFDSEGRIYIANNDPSEGIIRVDNIEGLNPLAFGVNTQIVSLTIDRENNVIYYSDGSTVYRNNLNGTNQTEQINSDVGLFDIKGLAVDNGYLYITENPDGGLIIKYNLTTSSIIISKSATDFGISGLTAWGIIAKDDKLFVTNLGGESSYQILELSTSDLSLIGHYGNQASGTDTSKGQFYGPRGFVAILNKKLTIIDDASSGNNDKLVSIDDITGSEWETLPKSGNGQELFSFYHYSFC